ncbi:MAG: hypothetical protein NVSMB62_24740 [Acidobacteriaceae bacterium]
METVTDPHISAAERLMGGLLITFTDGKSALYSAALLRKLFAQATELPQRPDGPEPLSTAY